MAHKEDRLAVGQRVRFKGSLAIGTITTRQSSWVDGQHQWTLYTVQCDGLGVRRYGVSIEALEPIEAVLPQGDVLQIGTDARR